MFFSVNGAFSPPPKVSPFIFQRVRVSFCQKGQTGLLFDIWFMFSKIIRTAVQLVTGFSKASLCLGLLVHLSSNASACHFLIRSVNEKQEIHFFFSLKYLGVHQKAVWVGINLAELDYTVRCCCNLTSGLSELSLKLKDSGSTVRSMWLNSL